MIDKTLINERYFDTSRIPLFVCIGTSRNKIDMFGACVGSRLKERGYKVIGTEEDNLTALNMQEKLSVLPGVDKRIYQIIAVDASAHQKYFSVNTVPIQPGSGLGKALGRVGETSIRVNVLNNLPMQKQINETLYNHEQYEFKVRSFAREVAGAIHVHYTVFPSAKQRNKRRAVRNASLVLEGLTHREIAAKTGTSKSTVQRDIEKLRDINVSLWEACHDKYEKK